MLSPRVRGVHVGAVPGRAHLSAEAILPDQDVPGDRQRNDVLHPALYLLQL